MSGTSPKPDETDGNPVSSAAPAAPASRPFQQEQQQPKNPQQSVPQQPDAVPNTTTSATTTNKGAPQQPLFLKPHPDPAQILKPHSHPAQIYASAVLAQNIMTKPYSAIQAGFKSPLKAAKTIVGELSKQPASATAHLAAAVPVISAAYNPNGSVVLPKPPATTTVAPLIQAPFNPHVARGQGVKEPLPTDVICGRGKMTASHPANRRFRELVDSHKAAYQNSKRRDEKTRITCELVDKLRAEGRFVLFDPVTKLWHEVSEEYAREKVSHSLRSRSSTEQRIANASNSMKMLNNAVHPDTSDSVVNIAPRGVQPLTSLPVPKTSKASPIVDVGSSLPPSKAATKSKQQQQPRSNRKLPTIGDKKKTKGSTIHKGSSSSGRSKHSTLKPGLDEIVKRLIKDQQKLLRMMIQKETDRFTSAAAMGGSQPPRPPMPLSYKAEASAVSQLTASLPKLEGAELDDKGNANPTSVLATAPTAASGSDTAPTDETHSSNMSTTVTA